MLEWYFPSWIAFYSDQSNEIEYTEYVNPLSIPLVEV